MVNSSIRGFGFSFLFVLVFVSCGKIEPITEEESNKGDRSVLGKCFPKVHLHLNKDTIMLGEKLSGTLSLSDTSYFKMIAHDGRSFGIKPIMRINGSKIEINGDKSGVFSFIVNDSIDFGIQEKTLSSSILFPHPHGPEGDVMLKKVFYYYVRAE
ncbi:MAG: hypothetical protein ACJAWV_004335 [Flammeovirgaceae bacterium]|jgi:hypothetical protein